MSSHRRGLVYAALPLLLAVGGCFSSGPSASDYRAQADVTGSTSDLASTRPVRGADLSLALASMPEPGGSQINMREKFYANGVKQDIVLAGDKSGFGENQLQVVVQTAAPTAGARDQAPLYRPSESGIKNEILQRYPQVEMQIVTQPRRNAMGPFGLAIGRHSSGTRCVFAWQWIDDVRNPTASTSSLGKLGSFGSSTQPASIRVHMCRKDATVDDLAMAVEGLQLAPSSVMDRVLESGRGAPTTVATRVTGGSGVVAAASDGSLEGALTTAVRPSRATQVAASPEPSRKKVARRLRPKADPDESVAQQSPVTPTAPTMPSGPRYLAPVAGGAPAGYAAAPVAAAYNAPQYAAPAYASASASTKGLDPSLPAAAYRGPGGR